MIELNDPPAADATPDAFPLQIDLDSAMRRIRELDELVLVRTKERDKYARMLDVARGELRRLRRATK